MLRLRSSVIACLFLSIAASARADDARLIAFRDRPLAEKLATPRATLETLCFSADASDKIPALLTDMVACLDINAKDGYQAGAAELLAVQMNEILDELSLEFIGLAAREGEDRVTFINDGKLDIVLARCTDKLWRFDKATVARIPAMRQEMARRSKLRNTVRVTLREGLEDPTATITSFLEHAVGDDFESAAARLDLGHLPADKRANRGPLLAWKLACVIQRRGYVYRQSVPIDPDGAPYTWTADATGRIAVERVHQPGGKDTWLFTRATVDAIDTMYEREKANPPDPRYLVIKSVIPPAPENVSEIPGIKGQAPPTVAAEQASPRTLLRSFFRVMDEAEFDDAKLREAPRYLDLSHLPTDDLNVVGPRFAHMLEVVFRKMKPVPLALSDHWSAPPQVLTGPDNLRVEVLRGGDGCWRFSGETVARLPGMFNSISPKEKADNERVHGLGNPRETLATFVRAVRRRDAAVAKRCLDLTDVATSARDSVGPVLAFKLQSVLERTGRIYFQEIPNDPEGPRFLLYRGPLGRIAIARRDDDPAKAWRFTTATVSGIEAMYEKILELSVEPGTAAADANALRPTFGGEPGIWLRAHVPTAARFSLLGLQLYQWAGLVALVALAWVAAFLVARLAYPLLAWFFHIGAAEADRDLIRHRLGALRLLTFLLIVYHLLEWLDLPFQLGSTIYALETFMLTGVLVWAGFQWTDLGYLFYQRSGKLDAHRGLGDLVAPFTVRIVKLAVVLTALTYLVYQFGQGDSLRQFLTGLGVAGLAVSLAAQDSLKNLFATLLLIGDRTFRVGDRLVIGDKEGVVEQLGFRSTKLRTPEDSLLVLPNAMLAYGAIDNMGLRQHRRVKATFALPVTTPLECVAALRDRLREFLTTNSLVDQGRIYVSVTRVNEGNIELEIIVYLAAKDIVTEKNFREEMTCAFLRLAGELDSKLSPGAVRVLTS